MVWETTCVMDLSPTRRIICLPVYHTDKSLQERGSSRQQVGGGRLAPDYWRWGNYYRVMISIYFFCWGKKKRIWMAVCWIGTMQPKTERVGSLWPKKAVQRLRLCCVHVKQEKPKNLLICLHIIRLNRSFLQNVWLWDYKTISTPLTW